MTMLVSFGARVNATRAFGQSQTRHNVLLQRSAMLMRNPREYGAAAILGRSSHAFDGRSSRAASGNGTWRGTSKYYYHMLGHDSHPGMVHDSLLRHNSAPCSHPVCVRQQTPAFDFGEQKTVSLFGRVANGPIPDCLRRIEVSDITASHLGFSMQQP